MSDAHCGVFPVSSGQVRPAANGPLVIYTTGDVPYKGLVDLLATVSLLRQTPRRDVRLRVGGAVQGSQTGPTVLRAARRFRVQDAVMWSGPLPSEGKGLELLRVCVCAHTSDADNNPTSLARGMLVGVPCVASATDDMPSLVRDGHDDSLLRVIDDGYSLAGTMAEIKAEPGLAVRLDSAAGARALQRHGQRAIAETTLELYADVVTRRGQPHL